MSPTLRLELKQTQHLTMTPQLRQAITLLQMSNVELTSLLEAEVEKNPLLEFVTPLHGSVMPQTSRQFASAAPFDPTQHIEFKANLRDDLNTQIHMSERDPSRAALACQLVDELDENGFLATPVPELSTRLKRNPKDIDSALNLLQTCEPVGVGARDLRECLALQLVDSAQDSPVMRALLDHLDLLATGNFAALTSRLDIPPDTLDQAIRTLQTLNPRPTSGYDHTVAQTAVPDIFVTKAQDGTWLVDLNTAALPKVLVNEDYSTGITAGKTREYLVECRTNARFLIRAMEQRAKTILRVATHVVRHQNRFFDSGISGLRPLTLAVVASDLGIHEATVSRVTRGKYLECPRGNFEMRYFFIKGIATTGTATPVARTIVQDRIRQLIALESGGNVFSDERIVKTLRDEGVDIARRTVAKYRGVMGIPSSSRRRRKLSQTSPG